jgi:protein SCO1/2
MKLNAHALPFNRRQVLALSASWLAAGGFLAGCSPQAPTFKSTDITGATFAQDLKLTDHTGQVRTMADFRGKVIVVFFGFTQCPDVCPTSMTTLAEVKRLMGDQGSRLQVLFITVDPERDTMPLLKEYMTNFDPGFLALRPEPAELKAVADSFKITYRKVEGTTSTSYTMDHSAGKYVFDTNGAVRLYSSYGTEPAVIAEDILTLLKSMDA